MWWQPSTIEHCSAAVILVLVQQSAALVRSTATTIELLTSACLTTDIMQ
jgi:hypothetical protein